VTNIQTTTIDAAHGFFGGPVFVDIASGTGSNQSLNFSPSSITVVLGVNSTVIWTNHDSVQHTVTADTVALFNSQAIDAGHSFGYTFTQAGTYGYSCQFHGYMIGKVIVKA
jgi:plastocyanin